MEGAITVTGSNPDEVPHSGSGAGQGANAEIEPDPEAPEYVPRDATAPDLADGDVHEIELVVTEREMTVAPGIVQTVWTFGDSVPGPVLRVKVGDTVRITLVNPETNELPHSIDFHASRWWPGTTRCARSTLARSSSTSSWRSTRASTCTTAARRRPCTTSPAACSG